MKGVPRREILISDAVQTAERNGTEKASDQPIDRIFSVIDAIIDGARPMTLAEIGNAAGLPAPTVHRLVGTLEERGLVKRATGSRKHLLAGPRLIGLGRRILETTVVADEPHRILERLAVELDEHCQIGTLVDGEVRYIDSVRARRTSGLHLEQGKSAPLHCTSMGKLFLASMNDAAFRDWLDTRTLERMTAATLTDRKALRRHIETVRQAGWASSNEEYAAGVVGCAVLVPDGSDRPLFALGISAPTARISHDMLQSFVAPLRDAAAGIAQVIVG
jgi:DNA-binding IclR family transcriptional regulator